VTPSQLDFYQELKKYRKFPAKELNKFPHLAHLKTPAERYKWFCERGNRQKALIPELVEDNEVA
jgi:hypothetical protein